MSARVFGPAYGAEYCANVMSSLAAASRFAPLEPRPGARAAVVELELVVALAQHAPIAVKSTATATLFRPAIITDRDVVVVASALDVTRASSTSTSSTTWGVLAWMLGKDCRTPRPGVPIDDARSPRSGMRSADEGSDVIAPFPPVFRVSSSSFVVL